MTKTNLRQNSLFGLLEILYLIPYTFVTFVVLTVFLWGEWSSDVFWLVILLVAIIETVKFGVLYVFLGPGFLKKVEEAGGVLDWFQSLWRQDRV